jgi:hypothetical protein
MRGIHMTDSGENSPSSGCDCAEEGHSPVQRILVFQQHGSGDKKIKGIREHGGRCFLMETVSIDEPLPPVLDDGTEHLPKELDADLVLDFLRHPDLSEDLVRLCERLGIPVVASGKKWRGENVFAPPT